ncbi:hypothetical protein [Kitasatospora aureofaciens]
MAGWTVDLGNTTGARATGMTTPFWLRMTGHLGSPEFNYSLRRPE